MKIEVILNVVLISPSIHVTLSLYSLFYSRPSSPKSDSELLVKPQETSGPQMQWNWGGFPKVLCFPPTKLPLLLFLSQKNQTLSNVLWYACRCVHLSEGVQSDSAALPLSLPPQSAPTSAPSNGRPRSTWSFPNP